MQRRVSEPWMESFRAGLSWRRSPFLNQWMVLTTMSSTLSVEPHSYFLKQQGPAPWRERNPASIKQRKNPVLLHSRLGCSWEKPADARTNSLLPSTWLDSTLIHSSTPGSNSNRRSVLPKWVTEPSLCGVAIPGSVLSASGGGLDS